MKKWPNKAAEESIDGMNNRRDFPWRTGSFKPQWFFCVRRMLDGKELDASDYWARKDMPATMRKDIWPVGEVNSDDNANS